MSIRCGLSWVAFLLFAATGAAAVSTVVPANDPSIYLPPLAGVTNYARAHNIPLEGINLSDRAEDAKPGDAVVLLVTFFDAAGYEQWLVVLQTTQLNESERQKKPPSDIVIYTITGQQLRFPGAWTAVSVRTIGPFQAKASADTSRPPKDRNARALVRTSFLDLGFDRSCVFILRTRSQLKLAGSDNPGAVDPEGVFSWSVRPFPPEKVAEGKRLAAEIGMTPADERQIDGVMPALAAFLRSVEKVPGLPERVLRVVAMPSLWSVLKDRGLEAGIVLRASKVGVIQANRWGLPYPVYALPFELRIDENPTLNCSLAVTQPRRPLLTCAGILGMSATNPKHPEKRLSVRVLATRTVP